MWFPNVQAFGKWHNSLQILDSQQDFIDVIMFFLLCHRYTQTPLAGQFEGGSGPIYLDDVHCSGQEASLVLCPRSDWGRHDCSHQEDVTVICTLNADNDIQEIPFGEHCLAESQHRIGLY